MTIKTLVKTHGLAMVRLEYASECDGRSGVYLGAAA